MQIVAHQGVEDVIVVEEMHTVLHQVINELTQDYLFSYLWLQLQKSGIDFTY